MCNHRERHETSGCECWGSEKQEEEEEEEEVVKRWRRARNLTTRHQSASKPTHAKTTWLKQRRWARKRSTK